jgi:hypothetical protein
MGIYRSSGSGRSAFRRARGVVPFSGLYPQSHRRVDRRRIGGNTCERGTSEFGAYPAPEKIASGSRARPRQIANRMDSRDKPRQITQQISRQIEPTGVQHAMVQNATTHHRPTGRGLDELPIPPWPHISNIDFVSSKVRVSCFENGRSNASFGSV